MSAKINIYQDYIKPKLINDIDFRNSYYAKQQTRVKKINNNRYKVDEEFKELKKTQALDRYYKNKQVNNDKALERYYEKKAIKFFTYLFD